MVQWLRICFAMQGTPFDPLVQEDPSGLEATKLVCHNYWACALEPAIQPKRRHRSEKPLYHA